MDNTFQTAVTTSNGDTIPIGIGMMKSASMNLFNRHMGVQMSVNPPDDFEMSVDIELENIQQLSDIVTISGFFHHKSR